MQICSHFVRTTVMMTPFMALSLVLQVAPAQAQKTHQYPWSAWVSVADGFRDGIYLSIRKGDNNESERKMVFVRVYNRYKQSATGEISFDLVNKESGQVKACEQGYDIKAEQISEREGSWFILPGVADGAEAWSAAQVSHQNIKMKTLRLPDSQGIMLQVYPTDERAAKEKQLAAEAARKQADLLAEQQRVAEVKRLADLQATKEREELKRKQDAELALVAAQKAAEQSAELKRQQEAAQKLADLQKQEELKKQAESQRLAEIQRQDELKRQAEIQRQDEIKRQAELKKQAELQRQLDSQRQQQEKVRLAEEAKRLEQEKRAQKLLEKANSQAQVTAQNSQTEIKPSVDAQKAVAFTAVSEIQQPVQPVGNTGNKTEKVVALAEVQVEKQPGNVSKVKNERGKQGVAVQQVLVAPAAPNWSEWSPVDGAPDSVEWRFQQDVSKKDDYGVPHFIQFRNRKAQRVEFRFEVKLKYKDIISQSKYDYAATARLSQGEESSIKETGGVEGIQAINIAWVNDIEAAPVAPTEKEVKTVSATVTNPTVDSEARLKKLELLRAQVEADSQKVAGAYRKASSRYTGAQRDRYNAQGSAFDSFVGNLQRMNLQNASMGGGYGLFSPQMMNGGGGASYGVSPLQSLNQMMRSMSPEANQVSEVFDSVRAMSALDMEQSAMLDKMEGAIGGIASIFGAIKQNKQEKKRRELERTKSLIETLQTNYETAKTEATPESEAFVNLCVTGDLGAVNNQLKSMEPEARKTLVNQRAANGDSPMHVASALGNLTLVQLLHDAGANLNLTDPEGRTPLHRAAEYRQSDTSLLLVSWGADRTIKNIPRSAKEKERTPVDIARDNKDKTTEQALNGKIKIAKLSAPDATEMHKASAIGNAAEVETLISNKNPNMRDELGWTPLHHAAAAGQLETMQTLLDAQANVNSRTSSGKTPLMIAVERDQPLAVVALLRNKADRTLKDKNNQDVLAMSKSMDRPAIQLLLEE